MEYQENVCTQQEKVEQTNFVFNLTGGSTYLRSEEQKENNIICLYIFHSHNCQLGIHSLLSSCTSSTYSSSSSSSSSTSLPSIVVVHTILFHLLSHSISFCVVELSWEAGLTGWHSIVLDCDPVVAPNSRPSSGGHRLWLIHGEESILCLWIKYHKIRYFYTWVSIKMEMPQRIQMWKAAAEREEKS